MNWIGFPAAESPVVCGADTHRLRWEAGELRALDHDDLEGERTLAALGGTRSGCIDVIDAWHRYATDLRVLVLASRGPSDVLAAADPQLHRGAPPMPAPMIPGAEGLAALFALHGGLPDRLVATVAASWASRTQEALPPLHAALYGRLVATLRPWLGDPNLDVTLELGEKPSLVRDGSRVRAELPFTWLTDVWARGLAVTWGRFCLVAGSEDGRSWTLTTVGPDLGAPEQVGLELPY
jgi:hypothetical protein